MDIRAALFLPTVVRLVPEPRFLASQGEPGSFERVETPPSRKRQAEAEARGASTRVKSLPMWKARLYFW
jgi:hypothetical protein